MLFAQKRKNNIESLRYTLRNKAILISNFAPDQYNDAIKDYNDLMQALNKEINRELELETKSFAEKAFKTLEKFKGRTVKDLLKSDTIELGSKMDDSFSLDTNKKQNWSQVNG